MESDLKIRMAEDADIALADDWAAAHGYRLPLTVLPRLGIVVDDESGPCAAVWLHMDNSIGVCWPENPVTRPGMSVKAATAAFRAGMEFLEAEALRLGYGVMMCHTRPSIARVLKRVGFRVDSDGWVKMYKILGGK